MVDTIFTFCVAVSLVSGHVATEALPLPIPSERNTRSASYDEFTSGAYLFGPVRQEQTHRVPV